MKAVMALPPSLISIGMELIGMDLRNMRIMSLSGSCGRLPASPSAYTDATILEPTGSSAHSPNVDHSSSGRALPLLPDSKTELVRRGNKVVYDLGDKIVKVFNETKPVSDVFNEALNLARINECGIRSPKALEVSQLENANGWALVTEKVPGTTLAEKMAAEPQRFGEYLEMFVDLQIEIHGYTSPLLNRQRDKFARMIDSLDQLNATTRYNLQERLDGMTKEFKVCHGDFNPSNVIVGDDGQLYVCDWAHATQGSPAADVATTYLLFALNSKDQAEAYLELYCDRADMPMQVVRQWTSIVAASELARKRNVNDEFLKDWIDVVDYQ